MALVSRCPMALQYNFTSWPAKNVPIQIWSDTQKLHPKTTRPQDVPQRLKIASETDRRPFELANGPVRSLADSLGQVHPNEAEDLTKQGDPAPEQEEQRGVIDPWHPCARTLLNLCPDPRRGHPLLLLAQHLQPGVPRTSWYRRRRPSRWP